MQDVGGGHAVNDFGTPLARGIGFDQVTFDRGGRKPLVPENYGHHHMSCEVSGEGAGRLGARTFGAVEIEGETDDERADLILFNDFAESFWRRP